MSTAPALTGPEAIEHALKRLDLEKMRAEQQEVIRSKKKTARPRAVRLLNILDGFDRGDIKPEDLMVRQVPVVPPKFRPFSITGSTYLPGDANELYRDLIEFRRLYQDSEKVMGQAGAGDVYNDMRRAAKALYGYGDSPNPKTAARSVKGFFKAVTGTSPKTSFYQSKMLSKPVDNVGRAVIVPDPELGFDEIGIPEKMAWKQYATHVQRRLVRSGMSAPAAFKHLTEQSAQARRALEDEMVDRPGYASRAPAWHDHNVVGQYAKIVEGDAIRINPYISEGANADFDGDTMTFHVPAQDGAVDDVKNVIMASKMPWSIKEFDKTMGNPKHEMLIGLNMEPSGKTHKFASEDDALKAIEREEVDLNDEIIISK